MHTEVVTIGLGYIGFPTSEKGSYIINKKVIDTINKCEVHIVEPDLD